MDENNKELELSPEEQRAEEEATKEVNEDELREKLADELGIDPDDQSDILDKLVEREKSHREKLSGAIKQKIKYRTLATDTSKKPKENPKEGNAQNRDDLDIDKLLDQKLTERLERQELESLKLTDELKSEVKDLAKLKEISIREAAQHPYILSRKAEIEREERIRNASPKRTNKGSYVPSYDPSQPLDPDSFDFSTEEGVKAWREARAARERHRSKNG